MRPVRGLLIVLSGACGSGCFSARNSAPDNFLCQADRNVAEAPIRASDEVEFIKKTRKQAEQYWKQVCQGDSHPHHDAYHDGFVDGFVDYVEAGGSGEPPFLPPFRYRLTPDRSPEGMALVEDWYAGFRHGSSVARASGLRELSLIPLPSYAVLKDLNDTEAGGVVPAQPSSTGTPGPNSGVPPAGGPGTLPMPRPVFIPSSKENPLEAPPTIPVPAPVPAPFGGARIVNPPSGALLGATPASLPLQTLPASAPFSMPALEQSPPDRTESPLLQPMFKPVVPKPGASAVPATQSRAPEESFAPPSTPETLRLTPQSESLALPPIPAASSSALAILPLPQATATLPHRPMKAIFRTAAASIPAPTSQDSAATPLSAEISLHQPTATKVNSDVWPSALPVAGPRTVQTGEWRSSDPQHPASVSGPN